MKKQLLALALSIAALPLVAQEAALPNPSAPFQVLKGSRLDPVLQVGTFVSEVSVGKTKTANNTDKVGLLYADNPVCDFKAWPGSKGDWEALFQCYGFKSEEDALAWPSNPVDNLAPIIKAGIPIVHSYGDADEVVPWEENTKVMAERAEALGAKIQLYRKPGCHHHPHGPEDPVAFTDWVLAHVLEK